MEKVNAIDLKVGDTVKIYQKGRSPFTGIVIKRHAGNSPSATFCVRAVLDGIGVEKIYPIHSPLINQFEIIKRAKVRRSKLYYLRKAVGKIKLKEFKEKKSEEPKKAIKKTKISKTKEKLKAAKKVKTSSSKSNNRKKSKK